MESIEKIVNKLAEGSSKSINQLLGGLYTGRATAEDRQFYIDNYMSAEEKEIGKPLFEMNSEEQQKYKVMTYNNKQGNLQGYDCPKCKNRGDFLLIQDGYEVYKTCACWSIRNTIRRMEECGLGNLLSIYTFDKYECEKEWQQDTFNKAKAFVTSDKNWFCMLGESGAGKSHICTAISRELLKQGMDLKYMMWLDEVTILNQSISNDPNRYEELMKELKDAQVLYIDDFFKSDNDAKPSPADIKRANEIINYRYNKARMDRSKRWITILSSERTFEQLLEYDKALAGRIFEMTKPDNLIMLSGIEKNYRLK